MSGNGTRAADGDGRHKFQRVHCGQFRGRCGEDGDGDGVEKRCASGSVSATMENTFAKIAGARFERKNKYLA